MRILINNKIALIKSGSSFDLISENRLFTGSDSYTLNIEFPLRDCPENIAIFGFQNRTDSAHIDDVFECEITDGTFHKIGVVTVTERNETFVKTQFLEGRSALNYKSSFDEIYLNELSLGYPQTSVNSYNGIPYDIPEQVPYDPDACTANEIEHDKYVALPWVNNNSGNVQNDCIPNRYNSLYRKCKRWSFQPYLVYLTELIIHRLGYTYDLSKWKNSTLKNIICCNALPAAWEIRDFARALPHWTITEYFEQLEKLLPGEFDIDHKTQHISFDFHGNILNNLEETVLDQVLDDFSVEHTKEDESEYKFTKNQKYSDCSHRMWKFYSCHWFIKQMEREIVTYSNYDTMLSALADYRTFTSEQERPLLNKIFYVRAMDTYFVLKIVARVKDCAIYRYDTMLEPVNMFGAVVNNSESEDYDEMGFVPVWIDDTDMGKIMFLECSEYDEKLEEDVDTQDEEYLATRQTSSVNTLSEGERTGKAEYFDKIYFAYWQKERIEPNKYYRPIIDEITLKSNGWDCYFKQGVNFRINQNFGIDERDDVLFIKDYKINAKEKYTFKFLSDSLPNVRSVFHIKGSKFLCKKMTATFSENGMSKLIKGEFYKVIE